MPAPLALETSIARFTELFNADVSEQVDVSWERVLAWLETPPTSHWDEKCPGWSPVLYNPQRRARENVKAVYGLVLDYDKKSTWDGVVSLWRSFYGLVYTTKSHNVGSHRLRVVLPLSRPVNAEEYARLWVWAERQSKTAELIVDGQAKDASRFWYNPTLPDGDTWRAQRLDGDALDVDATLPIAVEPPLRAVPSTRPPPTDRDRRARAYVAKIPGAVSGDRGHTQTFNAVAHVMFGFDLDAATTRQIIADDYNPRCDPPWSDRELDHKIDSVARLCKRERGYLLTDREPVHTTQQASSHAPPLDPEVEVNWRDLLLVGDKSKIKRGYNNVLAFVRHHPDYRGRWSVNTMTGDIWFDGVPMRDTFVHDIRAHADRLMGFCPGRDDVEAAILTSAQDRPFHPIQQYLRSVDWDGIERLSAIARDYFGSASDLHAELVRKWMISAIARAFYPGSKVDTALMLYGPQGYFKSSFFAILGGAWHADSPIDIANKDSFQQIHAAWIYEFAELENVVHGRAESRLKAWLTSTHDMFRAPYARVVSRRARSCVICGSTNRKEFLTDDTGSRRFWIVPVTTPIPRDTLLECRDQLWAEAVCAFEAGETWWLDRAADAEVEESNEEYSDLDPWHESIAEWISRPGVAKTSVSEILESVLKVDKAHQDRPSQMRVGRVMRSLKWIRVRETTTFGRVWRYRPPAHRTVGQDRTENHA